MSRIDLGAAIRAWSSYRGAGVATRAFLAARPFVLPLGSLTRQFERLDGRVLSVGSGHALIERYLAELNPRVRVEGYELDEERVALAARSQERAPRVVIHRGDVTALDASGIYDGAVAIDMLHHIPFGEHATLAAAVRARLRSGGLCIVKDIDIRPRWKHGWNRLHDRLAAGEKEIWCRAAEDMAAVFTAKGFELESTSRPHRLMPYPHYLLVLRAG